MVIMLHWMFLTYRRSMSSWRDSCFALFRPQNVKWIAFCNVIFLVMMIKILTFNNDNKYTSQSRTNSTDFHSNNNNQDFAQLEEEDLSKARHVNFWRHLVAGGDWFSLRLPPMLEQNPSLEELFRPGRGLNSDKKTKHCDLCVGGRPKREISWNVFLQMYDRQCTALNVVKKINTSLPTCPCVPKTLVGRQAINISQTFDASRRDNYSVVGPGGYWKPTDCYSRDRVAIIIPFRDRQAHLSILLEYLHPLLQRQQIEYRIFVVEQAKPYVFNKAAIMNTGYLEAKQLFQFDCVVFHDVDMIPEDDRNFYSCINSPRHIAPYVNKWNYTIGYMFLIGGALLLKPDEFERVNGFSNQFYGWGGEDDDMFKRLQWQKTEIYRYPRSVARYTMIQHERDKGNPLNKHAGAALNVPKEHYRKDGINSIKYYLRTIENYALYTWIYVELPEPKKS